MKDVDETGEMGHRIAFSFADKVFAAVVVAVLIGLPSYLWKKAEARADKQDDTLRAVDTRTQVMSQQMATIATQLADIPALRTQMAENKVQVSRNTDDISELRAMRGLK